MAVAEALGGDGQRADRVDEAAGEDARQAVGDDAEEQRDREHVDEDLADPGLDAARQSRLLGEEVVLRHHRGQDPLHSRDRGGEELLVGAADVDGERLGMAGRLDRAQAGAEGRVRGEAQRLAEPAELVARGVAAGEQPAAAAHQQRVGVGLARGVEVEQPRGELADADVDADVVAAAHPRGHPGGHPDRRRRVGRRRVVGLGPVHRGVRGARRVRPRRVDGPGGGLRGGDPDGGERGGPVGAEQDRAGPGAAVEGGADPGDAGDGPDHGVDGVGDPDVLDHPRVGARQVLHLAEEHAGGPGVAPRHRRVEGGSPQRSAGEHRAGAVGHVVESPVLDEARRLRVRRCRLQALEGEVAERAKGRRHPLDLHPERLGLVGDLALVGVDLVLEDAPVGLVDGAPGHRPEVGGDHDREDAEGDEGDGEHRQEHAAAEPARRDPPAPAGTANAVDHVRQLPDAAGEYMGGWLDKIILTGDVAATGAPPEWPGNVGRAAPSEWLGQWQEGVHDTDTDWTEDRRRPRRRRPCGARRVRQRRRR